LNFLKLIRYKNLILILFTQCLIHQGFLGGLGIPVALSHFDFYLLVSATIFLAAAGYIINDIYDIEIDRINKPDKSFIPKIFSEKQAFNFYFILNILGVGLGFYLSYSMNLSGFALIFVLISALLYVYASFLKRIVLIGNLLISALVASSIFIIIPFDLLPILDRYPNELANPISVLRDYAVFAFILNFLREIIKDIEDLQGDYNNGIQSLPILLGRGRTSKIVAVLGIISIFILISYIYKYTYTNVLISGYLLFVIGGSLLYFSIKAWSADSKKNFAHLSFILKIIMLLGIFSLAVLTLSIKYAT
tara:strand:+ start:1553 stop:2470 length:918 start_codon:yes stop_codon:yes gene_type:complete